MEKSTIHQEPVHYWGERIYHYDRVISTNNLAAERARAGEGNGTVIAAGEQAGGRGRLERAWFSPPGGLWFSLILRPPAQRLDGITLLFSLWIIQFLEESAALSLHLIWPNDLYLNGKKMGGILTESRMKGASYEWLVVGIGLNVNNREFPPDIQATSLSLEEGKPRDLAALLRELLQYLEKKYLLFLEHGFSLFLPEVLSRCPMQGRRIELTDHQGTRVLMVRDIGLQGQLVVSDEHGRIEEIVSAERVRLL